MGLLISYEDYAARVPGGTDAFTDDERARVTLLLADTSSLIRDRRPLIDQWLADGSLSRPWVTAVAFRIAQRVVDSVGLGGLVVRSQTHPEHAYELSDEAVVGLTMTDDEVRDLTPQALRPGRSRAFSVIPR